MSLRFKPLDENPLGKPCPAVAARGAARKPASHPSKLKPGLPGGPASPLSVQRGKKKGGLTRPADEKVART